MGIGKLRGKFRQTFEEEILASESDLAAGKADCQECRRSVGAFVSHDQNSTQVPALIADTRNGDEPPHRMRHFQITAVLLFAASIAGAVPTPYLPAVGPSPLRFLSSQQPGAGTSLLPPLLMNDPVPAAAPPTNSPVKAVAATPPATNAPSVVPTQARQTNAAPAVVTNAVVASPPPPAGPAFPMVDSADLGKSMTPQMLMQFFKNSGATNQTNGATSAVVLPLFTPPKAVGNPPSSTSTYRTP